MTTPTRLLGLLSILAGLALAGAARAECGGATNCIAVSLDASVAPAHGVPSVEPFPTPLAFGAQTSGTTSTARTVFVGAVTGAPASMATIADIRIGGTDAADFSHSGGTCTTGAPDPNLVHDGTNFAPSTCTVLVTFSPTGIGARTATLEIQTTAITRIVSLTGTGSDGSLPDPSEDADLRSLVRAQMQSAKRFAGAQVANLQRRMESLHTGRGAAPIAPGPVATGAQQAPPESDGDDELATRSARWLAALAGTGSASLWHSLEADGEGGRAGRTGFWAGGDVQFGTRDATGDTSSLRFTTDGLTLGIDRWFTDRLAFGLGLGYARSRTEIGDDGTVDTAEGSSFALYGSFLPTPETYVDYLLGYGELDFDTRRFSAPAAATARSERAATQTFGSVAAGYEFRRYGLLLSPYARLDFTMSELDRESETGAGTYALTYFSQSTESTRIALGLRAESSHPTDFGWALPRARLELQSESETDDEAQVAYVSDPGTRYTVRAADAASEALLLAIGSDFLTRGGLTVGLDYQARYTTGDEDSQSIGLRVAQDFGGRPPALSPLAPEAFEDPVQVDASYTADDNVNRARESADQLSDQIYRFDVRKTTEVRLTDKTRALLSGSFGVERLRKHDGLDKVAGGVRGEYQYRGSSHYTAPTLGLYALASLEDYESRLRAGSRFAVGLSARKRFTDRIGVFGALEHHVRDAESKVFDTEESALRFTLDYTFGESSAAFFGAEFRAGDTVSSAPSSPFYRDIADASASDDAYRGVNLDAVRYEAETLVWTLGYNQALGPRDSFELAWRRADSEPSDIPSGGEYDGSGPRNYVSDAYSAFYLLRF